MEDLFLLRETAVRISMGAIDEESRVEFPGAQFVQSSVHCVSIVVGELPRASQYDVGQKIARAVMTAKFSLFIDVKEMVRSVSDENALNSAIDIAITTVFKSNRHGDRRSKLPMDLR